MPGFKKIKQGTRLSDEVYDQLFAGINTGVINPNNRIIQEQIADELEVSRTPVREALLRLENEGILCRAGRSGFVIRRFTDQEAIQIYSAREAVECHAIGLLCQMNDLALAKRLTDTIERVEREPRYTITDYFEANKLIHRAFVQETENRFLLEMFDQIWNLNSGIVLFLEISKTDLSLSLKDHLVLCDALKSGDTEQAVEAMRAHIREGLRLQRGAMKKRRSGSRYSSSTIVAAKNRTSDEVLSNVGDSG